MYVVELVDKAIECANLRNDNRLSKVLDIPNGWIAEYRKGIRHPSTVECVKLAALIDADEMEVISRVEFETTKSEKKKEFWKNYIERRGLAACIAMTALAVSIAATPTTAEAILQTPDYDVAQVNFSNNENIHYAQSKNSIKLVFKALFRKWLQLVCPYYLPHNYKPIMS